METPPWYDPRCGCGDCRRIKEGLKRCKGKLPTEKQVTRQIINLGKAAERLSERVRRIGNRVEIERGRIIAKSGGKRLKLAGRRGDYEKVDY